MLSSDPLAKYAPELDHLTHITTPIKASIPSISKSICREYYWPECVVSVERRVGNFFSDSASVWVASISSSSSMTGFVAQTLIFVSNPPVASLCYDQWLRTNVVRMHSPRTIRMNWQGENGPLGVHNQSGGSHRDAKNALEIPCHLGVKSNLVLSLS